MSIEPEVGMYARWGHMVVRRRRIVLAAFLAALVVEGAVGIGVLDRLGSQGYSDPGSESEVATERLIEEFGAEEPFALLVVDSDSPVDDPAVTEEALTLVADLEDEADVSRVVSWWTSGRPDSLRSTDGKAAMVLVYATGVSEESIDRLGARFTEQYTDSEGDVRVLAGGWASISHAINSGIRSDLARAEAIAIPITLLLLLVVFGSVVAAGLPLLLGGAAIVGSMFGLFLVTQATDVSVYALNLVTGLGLGLGIDYALLVINRFREEMKRGHDTETAVVRTIETAGRTVATSGLTVAVTLAALIVFPQYFLKSFAYAGVIVVLLTVAATLSALPAVLAMLGPRINRGQVIKGDLAPKDSGMWSTVARVVMRRPLPILLVTLIALGALAMPALDAQFNQVDERVLPASNNAARASAMVRERFSGVESAPIEVVMDTTDDASAEAYAAELSRLDGITRTQSASRIFIDGTAVGPNPLNEGYRTDSAQRVVAVSNVPPRSPQGEELIERVRALESPAGTVVGGAAASYADAQAGLAGQLPTAITWIAVATLIVLFLYTGSVVLPVKALLLNVLSLSATLGLLVLVFQEGHLGWLVGDFTLTGSLDTSTLVIVAVVAFGLSMDYEIFLLSRVKEEHDAGRDTTEAVALGLQRSGRIITAAALLLAIVFASFVTSGITSIKMMGFGVAFAILADATVIRGLLVPAFMRIAGRWNWWAPAPLARIHARFGLSD